MKAIICLFGVLFLLTVNCSAQSTSSWLWGTEGISSDSGECEGTAVAVDANGNAFLTGSISDTVTVGAFNLTSDETEQNAFVIKYDPAGNVLWARQSQENSSFSLASGNSIAADAQGNVYVTGYFVYSIAFGSFQLQVNSSYGESMFLIKYDANGNVVWAKQSIVSPNGSSSGNSVTTDKSGNIYVTGNSQDTVSFGSVTLNAPGFSLFTVKYDPNGNVIWAKQPTRVSNDSLFSSVIPYSIAADKSNDVYITGYFSDSLVMGSTALYGSNIYSNYAFIAKYDSNGNVLWAKQSNTLPFDSFSYIIPYSITAGADGHIYLTGTFSDTVSFGNVKLMSSPYSFSNIFLVKLDEAGNAVWGKYSTSAQFANWIGYTVAADAQNHVYVSAGDYGFYGSDTLQLGSATLTVNDYRYGGNSAIMEFDTSGKVLCSSILAGGGDSDDLNGLACTPSGQNVYFGGDVETAFRVGPDSLPFYDSELPFMARWEPCCGSNTSAGLVTALRDTLCPGQTGSLLLTNNSSNNIQWQSSFSGSNFADIAGAKDTTKYKTNPLSQSTYYRAIIDSGLCSSVSNALELIVPPPLTAAFTATGSDKTETFNSDSSKGEIRSYHWDFGDGQTGGAANPVHTFAKDTIYEICLTIYDGSNCSFTYCANIDLRLNGIATIAAGGNWNIYPNPFTTELLIAHTGINTPIQNIEVYDMLGRLIINSAAGGINAPVTLNVSALAKGMYYVKLKTTDATYVQKVVKE